MKKFILGIAALVSIGAFAADYEYSKAYDKINPADGTYNKIDVDIINNIHAGIGLINGDGTGLDRETTRLKGKYLVPTSTDDHEIITFHYQDPEFNDLSMLEGASGNAATGALKDMEFNLDKGSKRNNVPLFMYAYDKTDNKIYKVYKEDGTRAVFRQINSEKVSKITPENLAKEDFKFGNGYIEAKDLYKFNIGEIKAKDTSKDATPELDRARHGVTGETVYNYLEKQNKEIKEYIDREVKREVEKYIKEFMKNK